MLDDEEKAAEHIFRHDAETGTRPDGVFFFIQTQEERIAQFPEGLGGILSVIFYDHTEQRGSLFQQECLGGIITGPARRAGYPGYINTQNIDIDLLSHRVSHKPEAFHRVGVIDNIPARKC